MTTAQHSTNTDPGTSASGSAADTSPEVAVRMTQTNTLPAVTTTTTAVEDRKAYRREWMRLNRAKAKAVNSPVVNNTDSVNSERVNTESVNTKPQAEKAQRLQLTEGERFRGQEFLRRAARHGADSKPGVYFTNRFKEMASSFGVTTKALGALLS